LNKRIRRKIRKRFFAEPIIGTCKNPLSWKLVSRARGKFAWAMRIEMRKIEEQPLVASPHFISMPYDLNDVICMEEDAKLKSALDAAAGPLK
jgi:hypothetical protein